MKRITLYTIFACLTCLCRANGDPVARFSALTLSKHPVGRHIPEIQLTDEKLEITGHGNYNHIKVTYTLSNNSNKDFHLIDYGFPIDWYGNHPLEWNEKDYFTESMVLYGWSDDYVNDIHFSVDGKELAWQCSEVDILKPALTREDIYKQFDGNATQEVKDSLYDALIEEGEIDYPQDFKDLCRRWYYTCFDFEPWQKRALTIEYSVTSNYEKDLNSVFSPFQEGRGYDEGPNYQTSSLSHVTYDFTPASFWGDGKAGNMNIDLKLPTQSKDKGIEKALPEALRHDDFWGSIFVSANDNTPHWVAQQSNFDLASAQCLNFWYRSVRHDHEDIEMLKSIRIPASRYTLKANGNQVSALSDNKLNTACQLAPDSANRYRITIDMHQLDTISGIIIYYGDASSKQNYLTHRRPDSILVKKDGIQILGVSEWIVRYTKRKSHPAACIHEKAKSLTWQDLTDVAERIDFGSPYDTIRKPHHFTIDLYTTDGTAPYVSEIILLGKSPQRKRFEKYMEQLFVLSNPE